MSDPRESFPHVVAQFLDHLQEISEQVGGWDRSDVLDTLAILVGDPNKGPLDKGVAGEIAALAATCKQHVSELMEADLEPIGRFMVERKIGRSRSKYQNRELWESVKERAADAAVDVETGEIVERDRLLIEHGVEVAQRVVPSPSSAWNSKPLRDLGIELDRYCDAGDVRVSLIVRAGDDK